MRAIKPRPTLWGLMVILILGGVESLPAKASESEPTEFIKSTMHTLFDAIEEERSAIDTDPTVARVLVRDLLTPHFDLERTCRWVLGKNWRRATDEQQARMVEEFRTLLVRIYAAAIADFSTLDMKYPAKGDDVGGANDVSIRVEAYAGSGNPTIVAYRLHRREGSGWKVYDITVNGVSLVTTYRSTFTSIIRESGMDGLIERLSDKNRKSRVRSPSVNSM